MAFGAGHAVWGLFAYRRGLGEIARSGVVDSVGDGLFAEEHSQDERAAAFWFMFTAPLVAWGGYLTDAAARAGDDHAERVSLRAMAGLAAVGVAVIPRSGFAAGLPSALWLLRRAGRARRVR
jgi:hypothetical protein